MISWTNFLKKCQISKDDKTTKHTHTRIGNKEPNIYGGSYHITPENENLFYQLYYNEVITGNSEEYLTEKQHEDGKLYIDMDFRYNYSITEKQHTKDDIQLLVSYISSALNEFVILDKPFNVYVMEKDNVNRVTSKDSQYTKDGIHILFDIEIPKMIKQLIRKKMIKKCEEGDVLDTTLPLTNAWDKVFDEGITNCSVNCQLYGSKKPLHEAYKLKYIFEIEIDQADNEPMVRPIYETTLTKDLFMKLCVRNKGQDVLLKNIAKDIINQGNEKKITNPNTNLNNNLNTNLNNNLNNNLNSEVAMWIKKGLEYDIFKKICNKYKGNGGRKVWFNFGFLLKDDVGEQGEDLFVELSKPDENFDEMSVRNLYKKINEYPKPDKPLTLGTIKKIYKDTDNEIYELINQYFKNNKKEQKLQQKTKEDMNIKKNIEDINEEQKQYSLNYEFDDTKLNRLDTPYFMTLRIYPLQKRYFELFVCKVLRPEPFYVYFENETNLSKDICMYSQNKIIEAFNHLSFVETIEKNNQIIEVKKKFISKWLEDDTVKIYNKVDFIPFNENKPINDSVFNLFRGFNPHCKTKYDKTKKDALLKPFKELWIQLCGGDEQHFKYFYKYTAHMFQRPNERIPIAFIFKGKQGTGKNMGLSPIGNLLGRQHYISSANPKDFYGDYAEGFVNKLLVNLNECEGKDTFNLEGKIKSSITDETVTINQKYIRPMTILMLARIIIFTNREYSIPLDVTTKERRIVAFQNTDYYLASKYGTKFWENLNKHFKRPDFLACLYDDLMEQQIDNVDWKSERPITEAYKQMCKRFVPVEVLFFEHYCVVEKINTKFLETNVYNNNIDCEEKGTDLYDKYIEFISKCKYNRNGERNLRNFYSKISELEFPVTIAEPHNIKTFRFNTKEMLSYFKERQWIEVTDEDIINVAQDNAGEDFSDLFNV
jgi:hypothetical protein